MSTVVPDSERDCVLLAELRAALAGTRLGERRRLARELERLETRAGRDDFAREARALAARMDASRRTVARLRELALRLEPDPALPISAHFEELREALLRHPVTIVAGATGSGKSTQLPKLCLAAGRGALGMVGHTQPRRIAARALASRIAEEIGSPVGEAVGYQVRFSDRTGPDCRIKVMTDGILLAELARDRELSRYDTLIIDEAHERSLNIDLLLGVLKQLCARRPELRVIVTSATIDAALFAEYFGAAPVIEVSGRSYPVEVRYRPLAGEDEDAAELSLPEAVLGAVRELDTDARTAGRDVLVFLPGEKHIREASDALARAQLPATEVLPLYSRLSGADQARIFAPHAARRVVLATNVAETSLTVPGIRAVVDSGLARVSRYSVRGKVQRLPIEPISRASAEQRRGRCGREGEGICIRLYSAEEFEQREEFTAPEILRTNLASVILQMAALGLPPPERFGFMDPPDVRLLNDGVRLLQELRAMDEERRVTGIGRRLARLPCDPRLGRMLLAAAERGCLAEILVIAALLAGQDPRERPVGRQQHADAKHRSASDPRSDFMTILALWHTWRSQAAALSRAELRVWCRENFLSSLRLREWQDLHDQLAEAAAELGLRAGVRPAGFADIHRAILSGTLGSIGLLEERREYAGARGTRFVIAPGTPLALKPPRWVVAASLIETTRLYARIVASIQPAWIEKAGAHLVKRTYADAYWDRARGQVMAFETVTLYGLVLASRRRVSYGPIDHAESRNIFIREALVAGDAAVRGEFLESNRQLRAQIEQLEAKIRRRDILVDESTQVDFYRVRIPEQVSSLAAFESWRREAERRTPRLLYMASSDLMRREASEACTEHYPDELHLNGNALPLRYVFAPGAPDDGLTLLVPDMLLEQLDAEQLAWLVPGLRQEKVEALLRALPKSLRKALVPVPDAARAALAALEQQFPREAHEAGRERLPGFHAWMAQWLTQRTGTALTAARLAALPLPDHLRLNVRVIATARSERVIAEGRDLVTVRRRVHAAGLDEPLPDTDVEAGGLHRHWDFGELPQSLALERGGARYTVYPALEDRVHGVIRVNAASAAEARALLHAGIARLAVLALESQASRLRRQISSDAELVLLSQGLALDRPLADAILDRAAAECLTEEGAEPPRSRVQFQTLLASRQHLLPGAVERLSATVRTILREWRSVRSALEVVRAHAQTRGTALAGAVEDIDAQLATLMPPQFIASTPERWLEQLPRYLQAIGRRLERLRANPARDAQLVARLRPFVAAWRSLSARRALLLATPSLEQFRWMIEEFRVSLFAQELKTLMPVSEKRLTAELARVPLAAGATALERAG